MHKRVMVNQLEFTKTVGKGKVHVSEKFYVLNRLFDSRRIN